MIKFLKSTILFLFSVFLFLFSFASTDAATLLFSPSESIFSINQQFKVDLVLNTENKDINAIEGKIVYPEELLELKEIRDGNSIINFWIEQPKLEQAGTIGFSGIIPGGYQDAKGFIFSIVFQAKSIGNGVIQLGDAKVLLNDGNGTEANLKISPFRFSISEKSQAVQPVVQPIKDTAPPEEFKLEITSNPDIFNGKWFIVFATQDKGLGIDNYQVCEGNKTKCVVAESPYVLKDQELRSYIYVKAVDKAGNERTETVLPKYPLKWYETWWIWCIIILGALLAIIIWYLIRKFLWRKFIKSR